MKKNLAHALPVSILALSAAWVSAQQGEAAPAVKAPVQAPPPAQAAPAKGTPAQGEKATPAAKPGAGTQTPPPNVKTSNPGKGATQAKPPAAPKPVVPKKAWQEFKLNPTTTMFLDFTESNPDAVISLFSRTSGITILKMPQFKTPLTLISAKAVKLNEAFEIFNTVLGMSGFELQKQGNLMIVAPKQPPQQPPMQAPPPPPQPLVKTYRLENAAAAQVAKVIVDVYGPAAAGGGGGAQPGMEGMGRFGGQPQFGGGGAPGGGGSANFKVTSDEYSNSVIVKAMPAEHTKIEELIKDLDKTTTTPLTSEVFKLNYVPADQAVTAIEDLLTANTPTGRGAGKPAQPSYNDYYYYGRSQSTQRTAGNQSATAIKQTNSVNVNATKENMELIRKLLKNLDQPFVFADNTVVIKLMNAKASDVAALLTKVFAEQRNNNDNGFFFFDYYGDSSSNNRNKQQNTDFDEEGRLVNTRDIQGKVKIEADPNTNSIVVVTQPSNMRVIQKVIDKLDTVTEQVVIETVVMEANLDKTTKLGVEYNFINDIFGGRGNGIGRQNFGLQSGVGANAATGATYTLSGDDYRIFLNAVQTDSRFKVLDTPRIFTSNNVKATINVGQSVPYPRQQNVTLGTVSTNVDFQEVGVILEVTPRIAANGRVTMDVTQSANDVAELLTFGTSSAPLVNTRKATTTVSVEDGRTVVLGGIIQRTERRSDSKVPLLGDIPLIGQLFRSTNRTQGQSELMVFLTPHIIRNNDDAQRIRQDSTNDLTKSSQDLLKKAIPPVKEP